MSDFPQTVVTPPQQVIRSRYIVLPGEILDGFVRLEGGRITEIGAGDPPAPAGATGVAYHDLGHARLLPGMIDLHIHGLGGWDTYDLRPETALRLAQLLAATGTTAYWPTLATASWEEMEEACRFWGEAYRREAAARPGSGGTAAGESAPVPAGARHLGLHLEGPFLNPRKPGAMRPEWMVPPDWNKLARLLELAAGSVRRVTLAPELPGALDLVRDLRGRGIVVAAGHSEATYEEARAAFRAGVTLGNHTYNAMRGLHHREPGLLGAVLDLPVDAEVIADGVHVHPAAIRILWRAKGTERVAVISDAVSAALLPPGRYDLHAFQVEVRPDGSSRLPDGTLAGSTATMLDCLRVLVEEVGVPLVEAARMTAAVPARIAGVGARKGQIVPGYDADLFAVDDGWRVVATWVEGVPVHTPERPLEVARLLNPRLTGGR
ncbi:MAG TPA: N-acetylglucosamine-6-phosphate deacetylase [Thermaerobacter sp.]